jgi:hypothetical protein
MSTHPASTADRDAPVTETPAPAYRAPDLTFVGSVTELVQSGPIGNRYETYRCSYWSDR